MASGYQPPKDLHPLAVQAFQLLSQGTNTLGPEAVAQLDAGIKALYGQGKPLLDALVSLGAVLLYSEQRGATQAAEKLRELIKSAKPEVDRIRSGRSTDAQDSAEAATAQLEQFVGQTLQPKTAPKFGETPPEGALRAASVIPNPALQQRPRPSLPKKK